MAKIPIEKWFGWIQDQIQSRSIVDSADIKASRGKTGTQLFLQKNSGGGEEGGSSATATGYDGPWKVQVNATNPTTQIDVVNDTYAWIGNQIITPTGLTGVTISATTYVCVRFQDTGSTVGDIQLVPDISTHTLQTYELMYPLAKVSFDAGAITTIEQIHWGFITYYWKPTRIV